MPLIPSEIHVKSAKSSIFRLTVRVVGNSIGKKIGYGVYNGTLTKNKHTPSNKWKFLESGEIDHKNTHYNLFVRFSGIGCTLVNGDKV